MDTSETGKGHPQGDSALLRKTLTLLKKIKLNLTTEEQITLLYETLVCIKMWCPISKLGVKKIEEHFASRISSRCFQNNILKQENSLKNVSADIMKIRAIELVADTGDGQLGWYENTHSHPRKIITIFLFLTDDLDIIGFKGYCKDTGEEILPAHTVELFHVNKPFLLNLIKMEHGCDANKHLVITALETLCFKMSCAQDEAQKRVNQIGAAHNTMTILSRAFKNVRTV